MSSVERLLTKPERELVAKMQIALDAVREIMDDLPASVTFPMLRELRKRAAPSQSKSRRHPFTMSDPELLMQIMRAIRDLPGKDRPHTVALAFMACHATLDWDTDRILLTQEELAKELGVSVTHASSAMNVLVRMGIVSKEYQRIEGVRGRGRVIYSINPHVAWKGDGQEAARAVHPKPVLTVVGTAAG